MDFAEEQLELEERTELRALSVCVLCGVSFPTVKKQHRDMAGMEC